MKKYCQIKITMSDFDIFDDVLRKYEENKPKIVENSNKHKKMCIHLDIFIESGITICRDCGVEVICSNISNTKEWRYYGMTDTRHTSDPSRCYARKVNERTIYKDVEGLSFSDDIIELANTYYNMVTDGNIYRGNSRKQKVFGCVYYAYQKLGPHQTFDNLLRTFQIDRKSGSKGIKAVLISIPKTVKKPKKYPIKSLINDMLDKFSVNGGTKNKVMTIYEQVHNKSFMLNGSRPQSVCAGLVYYWISKENKNITIKEFTKIVGLSKLTILKISREIDNVLKTKYV